MFLPCILNLVLIYISSSGTDYLPNADNCLSRKFCYAGKLLVFFFFLAASPVKDGEVHTTLTCSQECMLWDELASLRTGQPFWGDSFSVALSVFWVKANSDGNWIIKHS